MLIRTRLGVSADGFIASSDGRPAFLAMPDFSPHTSYDWPEFDNQCDAVVMGRVPLDAGLQASTWPWPEKQIYVLTSRPLPLALPADVVVAHHSPAGLLERLRAANLKRDAFLLGGQRTLRAFLDLGAVDRLELLVLPVIIAKASRSRLPAARRYRSASRSIDRSLTARCASSTRWPRVPERRCCVPPPSSSRRSKARDPRAQIVRASRHRVPPAGRSVAGVGGR